MAAEEAAEKGSKGVMEGLKKNVGPLPLGVWIAVIAGGLLIAYYVNRKSSASSAATTPTDQFGNPIDANATPSGTSQDILGYAGGYDSTAGESAGNAIQPSTNDLWVSQWALPDAIKRGYNPTTSATALYAYLNGENLSEDQNVIVQQVLADLTALGINVPNPPTTTTIAPGTQGAGASSVVGVPVITVPRTTKSTSVTVKWTPVANAATYQVLMRRGDSYGTLSGAGAPQYQVIASGITKTSYTVSNLTDKKGWVYQFEVRGVDAQGRPGYVGTGVTTEMQ